MDLSALAGIDMSYCVYVHALPNCFMPAVTYARAAFNTMYARMHPFMTFAY